MIRNYWFVETNFKHVLNEKWLAANFPISLNALQSLPDTCENYVCNLREINVTGYTAVLPMQGTT
jgi:hypothetical protein